MDKCKVCGGTEFYVDAGFYYCNECQTQHETKKEQDVEFNTDPKTRLRATRIQNIKAALETGNDKSLTSWEKYNYVLIGLTNELIELGAKEDIKLIVAQLWTSYLGKLEVAFVSTSRVAIPKLCRRYDKRDAQIIYGKIFEKTKKKKSKRGSVTSGSSASRASSIRDIAKRKKMLIDADYKSQGSTTDAESGLSLTSDPSELSDKSNTSSTKGQRLQFSKLAREETKKVAKLAQNLPKNKKKEYREHFCSALYKLGPDVITPVKLWAIIYLALRLNNDDIHMSDMFRFAKDGYLSYYKLDHFIPPDCHFTKAEASKLNSNREFSYSGLTRATERLKKFLRVWKCPHPNLLTLIQQYCTELQLPTGVALYAERILAAWPPKMNFNRKSYVFPNYEARAMAIIIVTMKILFGLDGVTENEMSRVVERINEVAAERQILDSKLFSFREWQRYIECRRRILINEHLPTKLRYDPHSMGNSHLYANFNQMVQARTERPLIGEKRHNYAPRAAFDNLIEKIEGMTANLPPPKQSKVFTPSLTPQHSYLQQLLEDTKDNAEKTFPNILRQDFPSTKVGYVRDPESVEELAAQCDIELNIVYSSAHYVRKVMQVFEPHIASKMVMHARTDDHNKLTRVVAPTNTSLSKKLDDPSEYLHRKRPGKILIETKKQRLYNKMLKLYEEQSQRAQKNLSEKNNQTVQEKSFNDNGDIVQDSLYAENSRIVQDKVCEENSQTDQDKSYEGSSKIVEDDLWEEYSLIDNDKDYFIFDQVLPNGKLKIPELDPDPESPPEKINKADNILLSNFEKQSIVNPIPNPWDIKKKFKCEGFAYKGNKPPPQVYRRPDSKCLKTNAANKEATQEVPKDTESVVPIVAPEPMQTSEIILIVVNEAQNVENVAAAEDTNKNNEIEVIFEDPIKNNEIEVIFEDTDKNKENEAPTEHKENEANVENTDKNQENEATSDAEMEVDFEAIEHKIDIDVKNIQTIEIEEPEPMDISNAVDEITINDESDKEAEDSPSDKEIIINDESSDDEVSILAESIDSRPNANQTDSLPEKELLTLFIPYKQYWLFRCTGVNHMVSRHFRLLEREFSSNFRWLLHECANVIETHPEELYKEVCLVESYYTDVLAPDEHIEKCEEYNTTFYRCGSNKTSVKKRWNS